MPEKPEWLSETASQVWDRVMRTQAPGVILAADPDVLTAYCEAVATLKQAQFEIRKAIVEQGGLTVETERGWVTNPAVNIAFKASAEIRHLGSLLGLNPASRSRINAIAPGNDNDADNWLQ